MEVGVLKQIFVRLSSSRENSSEADLSTDREKVPM